MLDAWEGKGSGWVIEQVQDIHININNYDPLAGSSYIPLPRQLQNSMHGLINIKNTGEKKVPGKMKDVKPLQNIDDVTALKSKSYIVITADNEEECKHKGHDYNFRGDEYKYAAFNKKVLYQPMKKVISIRRRLYTKECMKKTLYNFCEKRHLQSDEINTYALGHTNTLST